MISVLDIKASKAGALSSFNSPPTSADRRCAGERLDSLSETLRDSHRLAADRDHQAQLTFQR
jgi:hypothetical protein